jgi:hypothetical protein
MILIISPYLRRSKNSVIDLLVLTCLFFMPTKALGTYHKVYYSPGNNLHHFTDLPDKTRQYSPYLIYNSTTSSDKTRPNTESKKPKQAMIDFLYSHQVTDTSIYCNRLIIMLKEINKEPLLNGRNKYAKHVRNLKHQYSANCSKKRQPNTRYNLN